MLVELGNAATNISFPFSIMCVAIALLFGIGGASQVNLSMGKGKKEEAVYYMGNSAVMLFLCGIVLSFIILIFLEPLLKFLRFTCKCFRVCQDLYKNLQQLVFHF